MNSVLLVDESLYGRQFVPIQTKVNGHKKMYTSLSSNEFSEMLRLIYSSNTDSAAWNTNFRGTWVDRWGSNVNSRVNSLNEFLTDFTSLLYNVVYLKDFRSIKVTVSGKTMINWERVLSQSLVKFDKVMGNVVSPLNQYDVETLRDHFSEFVMNLHQWVCVMQHKDGTLETYYTHKKSALVLQSTRTLASYMRSLLVQRFELTHKLVHKTKPVSSKKRSSDVSDDVSNDVTTTHPTTTSDSTQPSAKRTRRASTT